MNNLNKTLTPFKSDSDGLYYFMLMDSNGDPWSKSMGYKSKRARQIGMASFCARIVVYSLAHPNMQFFNEIWVIVFRYFPHKKIRKVLKQVIVPVAINNNATKEK